MIRLSRVPSDHDAMGAWHEILVLARRSGLIALYNEEGSCVLQTPEFQRARGTRGKVLASLGFETEQV